MFPYTGGKWIEKNFNSPFGESFPAQAQTLFTAPSGEYYSVNAHMQIITLTGGIVAVDVGGQNQLSTAAFASRNRGGILLPGRSVTWIRSSTTTRITNVTIYLLLTRFHPESLGQI